MVTQKYQRPNELEHKKCWPGFLGNLSVLIHAWPQNHWDLFSLFISEPTIDEAFNGGKLDRLLQYYPPRFFYIILSCMDCRNLDVLTSGHRRRINTEEKTTVVAAVWGKEFIQFLAALAILHKDDCKNRMNSSLSPYHPGAIHPILQIVQLQSS